MTSDDFFGGLGGIDAPREVAVHTVKPFEELVVMGKGMIEKYRSTIVSRHNMQNKTYTAIEAELAGSELEYGVSDLQELVRAYCNRDDSEEEAITRGLYTGALASVLTRRNKEKGERTRICLNGDKNTFPYLLYHAHTLDDVTIENFRGDYIAAHAAGYGGTANNIMLTTITGIGTGADIASHNGRVGVVTLANITGDFAGGYIAHGNGRVGVVTLANITGDEAGENIATNGGRAGTVTLANITGDWAGAYIARHNGRAGIVTLANITGNLAGAHIAWEKGRVGIVTLANITGNLAGAHIATDGGRVDVLLALNNKGKDYLLNNHATRTITSLNGLANAQQIQSFLDELAQPDHPPEHYTTASKQLGELLREEKQ